jgi:predicted TIM-barrel fold metal-dependent hydrolase|tara:strand:- start:83 stop:1036 length:954 start_codon:yes stop_codon:yes gene_type:complete
MTIDSHCHLFVKEFQNESAVSPSWNPGEHTTRDSDGAQAEQTGGSYTDAEHLDPDGSGHIKRMNDAGIEKSIILHLDYGLLFGEAEMSIEQQNKYVSEVAGSNPDRLIWFCGIDPRRENAVELLEKCVTEWGARGIKLYPTTGFLPADKEAYPFYERASAWKIPVTFHMGPESPPFYNQGNAHAAVLLRVLVDFPDLTVTVAHLGFEFWRDLIALGKVADNVMCDFCAWQPVAQQRLPQFCYILRKFLDEFGRERVMFGTDAPILEASVSSRSWVEMIRNLPEQAPPEYSFSEDEVDALLDGNARRLLDSIPTQQSV